jgi:8-oxo-dGTP pyrophosphatase MutT (NUDIX family)
MDEPTIELIARGVFVHDGTLLVAKNRKGGHLFLPGGHVDFGEPAASALEREMMEELAAPLRASEFLGACEAVFHQTSRAGKTRLHHEVSLLFRLEPSDSASPIDPKSFVSQEAHLEFIWLPLDQIQAQPLLPPGIHRLTREILNPPRLSVVESALQ